MTTNPRLPARVALVCGAAFLTSNAVAQAVTATAVAHTALSVAASPYNQSLPAGTNLTAGANLSLNAGPGFDPGSASMVVSLATAPTLAYRIDAAASYSPTTPLPSPTCSYGGETLLTITPQGGPLVGVLRITFSHFNSIGSGPGNASVDVGNDGSIDWSYAGPVNQVHTIAVSQSGPLTIRTITNASVTTGLVNARDGDLLIEFIPTDVMATAVALTALSVSSGGNSQSIPAGANLSVGANIGVIHVDPMVSLITGGASLGVDLDLTPSWSFEITNAASSTSHPFGGPAPSSSSSGQTLLTISPLTGYLQGTLRITFSWNPLGTPGFASVDIGNDGSTEWTRSAAGSNPQVHELAIAQTSPLLVRTITGANANASAQSLILRIEYLPKPFWNEVGDAGETRARAQIPRGIGPMDYIAGSLGANDCDMYWIHIDDPSTFEATTIGGAGFDTQLWLFDRHGYGVSFNDDVPGSGNLSRLTDQFLHSPGNHLLAITRYDRDAESVAGAIWLDTPYTLERQPDGPGAGSPLTSWTGSAMSAGDYTIFLTGASFPDLGRLVAVDTNRSLYSVDPATGSRTQIGTVSANVGTPAALAYDPIRGVLFLSSVPGSLYSVDPNTGAATLIGPFGGSLNFDNLEFDISTGTLYGIAANSVLHRINTTTGAATAIGPTGFGVFSTKGLVHDARTNTMFALGNGNTWLLDRATGATTAIGALGISTFTGTALHAGTGITYAIDANAGMLYSVDLTTGAATPIGPTGGNPNGLVHLPPRKGVVDYGTGCAGQGEVTPLLRAIGPFPHTGAMTYELTGVAPLSLGFFAFGDDPVWVPLPFPGACPLHISPLLLIDGLFVTGPGGPGSGSSTFTVPLAPSAMGMELTAQGVVLENIDLGQIRTSNGVLILQ